mmetsp:Transcript_13071/g.19714  ORF Transcript_13071/g.19714 Transcript_13071/m.19714 type:complete len:91 (+) Transcript_13071:1313-1585(+)
MLDIDDIILKNIIGITAHCNERKNRLPGKVIRVIMFFDIFVMFNTIPHRMPVDIDKRYLSGSLIYEDEGGVEESSEHDGEDDGDKGDELE